MEMPSVWGVVTPEDLNARLARRLSKVESLDTGQGTVVYLLAEVV